MTAHEKPEIILRHEDYEGLSESEWLVALDADIADAKKQLGVEQVEVGVDHISGDHIVRPLRMV